MSVCKEIESDTSGAEDTITMDPMFTNQSLPCECFPECGGDELHSTMPLDLCDFYGSVIKKSIKKRTDS